MNVDVVQFLISLIPALFITLLAFYFFKTHTDNEERRRRFLLHRENQKEAFPLKLQAYERMVLFLERIAPGKLFQRMSPLGDDKQSYESLLINAIEQEYEHNLTQQIYMSDECWNTIKTAKNTTIAIIRKASMDESIKNAQGMIEKILTDTIEKGTPSDAAIAGIKGEIMDIL